MAIEILKHQPLNEYTSFGVGGVAEYLVIVRSGEDLLEVLSMNHWSQIWLLGYGSNTVISDKGLPGLTIIIRGGAVTVDGQRMLVDAGVWWDDVVKKAISANLWGIELMSEIPGSFGAALFINITAYGQSVGPLVEWVDVWDKQTERLHRISSERLKWGYKTSIFQEEKYKNMVILRACIKLQTQVTDALSYQKAIDVGQELGLNSDQLSSRRKIIIEARKRAGSLWSPKEKAGRTAGSFFKNPVVSLEKAQEIAAFDESGKTTEQILKMNLVHSGNATRVSAAHVMLAAGFSRGQKIGDYVQLHDKNLLKLEALEGASAQDIFVAMRIIQQTVQDTVGVNLESEAQLLGEF